MPCTCALGTGGDIAQKDYSTHRRARQGLYFSACRPSGRLRRPVRGLALFLFCFLGWFHGSTRGAAVKADTWPEFEVPAGVETGDMSKLHNGYMSTNENVLARQMLKSVLLTAFGDSITPAQADVALRAVNVLVDSGVLQFSEDRLDPATLAALQKEFKELQSLEPTAPAGPPSAQANATGFAIPGGSIKTPEDLAAAAAAFLDTLPPEHVAAAKAVEQAVADEASRYAATLDGVDFNEDFPLPSGNRRRLSAVSAKDAKNEEVRAYVAAALAVRHAQQAKAAGQNGGASRTLKTASDGLETAQDAAITAKVAAITARASAAAARAAAEEAEAAAQRAGQLADDATLSANGRRATNLQSTQPSSSCPPCPMASSGGSPIMPARSSANAPQKQQGHSSGFDDVFKGPAVQCSKEPPTLSSDKHTSSAGGFFTKHAAGEKAKQACDQSVWNRLALTGERSKVVRTLLSLSKALHRAAVARQWAIFLSSEVPSMEHYMAMSKDDQQATRSEVVLQVLRTAQDLGMTNQDLQWYSSAMGITLPDLQSASKEDLMEAADDITQQSAVQRAAVAVAQNVTVAALKAIQVATVKAIQQRIEVTWSPEQQAALKGFMAQVEHANGIYQAANGGVQSSPGASAAVGMTQLLAQVNVTQVLTSATTALITAERVYNATNGLNLTANGGGANVDVWHVLLAMGTAAEAINQGGDYRGSFTVSLVNDSMLTGLADLAASDPVLREKLDAPKLQEITADGMVDASELAYLYQRVQALNAVYNLDDLARLMIRVQDMQRARAQEGAPPLNEQVPLTRPG